MSKSLVDLARSVVVVVVIAMIVMSSCIAIARVQRAVAEDPPITGTLSGVITDSETREPVAGACVRAEDELLRDVTGESRVYTVTADEGGAYELELPEGEYLVIVRDCQGARYVGARRAATIVPGGTRTLDVELMLGADPSPDPDFDPDFDPSPGTARITGTLTHDGGPISGICVYANGSDWASDVTDEDGDFSLTGLVAGDYQVEAQDCAGDVERHISGVYVASLGGEVAGLWMQALTISLADGQELEGLDFDLPRAAEVSGRVVASGTDEGLAGVCVSVGEFDGGLYSYSGSSTTSRSDGSFTIWTFPGEETGLIWSDCGWGAAPHVLAGGETEGRDLSGSSPTTSLVVEAQQGGIVVVPLVEAVAEGQLCGDLLDEAGNPVGYLGSYTDGPELVSAPVVAGGYRVELYDCWSTQPSYAYGFLTAEGTTGSDFDQALVVEVETGAVATTTEATPTLAGSIIGRYGIGSVEAGPTRATVCVSSVPLFEGARYGWSNDFTDAHGRYYLSSLNPGTYRIEFRDCGSWGIIGYYGGDTPETAATVNVATGAPTVLDDVAAPLLGGMTGSVVDADSDEPVVGICVGAVRPGLDHRSAGPTGVGGTFSFSNLVPGTYEIVAFDCDGAPPYYSDSQTVSVEVEGGESATVGPIAVEVVSGEGVLSGTVFAATGGEEGEALADVGVTVCPAVGPCRETSTGSDGRYSFVGLPTGSAWLSAWHPTAHVSVSTTVDVDDDIPTTQDLTLVMPRGVPADVTIAGAEEGEHPSGVVGQAIPIAVEAEPGSTVTFKICSAGSPETCVDGTATESTTTPGHFTGSVTPTFAGPAVVTITIVPPEGEPEVLEFDMYIDPSGQVKTPEGDPIPDATVTLLRSATEDGELEPVPDGSSIMSPSNRQNPTVTDADGRYRWDVTPGFYVVTASKHGCVVPNSTDTEARSAVLPVPPIQTGIDLVLDCDPSGPPPGDPDDPDDEPDTDDDTDEEPPAGGVVCQESDRATFADVPSTNVHSRSIACASARDLIKGRADGSFGPDADLSRGQMALIIDRLAATAGKPFQVTNVDAFDDDDDSVYEEALNRLAAAGVYRGTADGQAAPAAAISRSQLAALLVRTYEVLGGKAPVGADAFDDDDGTTHETALNSAYQLGMIKGTGQGRHVDPGSSVRRDQAASLLVRSLERIVEDGLGSVA